MATSKKSDLKPKGNSKLTMSDTDQNESEDDENSGVDEEGLEKLMNALGEDGLDEYDLAQLRMLTGSAAGEESDEEEGGDGDGEEDDVEAASASEEEEEKSGEEDEIALDDEDVGSVDEDVIPRRKVEVDNKVASPFHSFTCRLI
jgi:rRNA-processing protein EBP2